MRAAAAALALAAAVAGCGGSGDELERFRTERLRPVATKVEQERAAVGRIIGTLQLGNARDARLLGQAVDRLDARAEEVRALEPPVDVAAATTSYAAAIDALAQRLRAYAGAVAAGRRGPAGEAAARASEALDLLVRRRQQLDREVSAGG